MIINKKTHKINYKKIIKIIVPIALIIIVIVMISNNIKRVQENEKIAKIKQYTSIDDFKTLEEVAIYMDCKYIKQEKSKTDGYEVDLYLELKVAPFTQNISNQSYYEQLFAYCAKVLGYNNFAIIDTNKDLVALIKCNKDNMTISNYYINGNEQYFQTEQSKIAKEQYIEIKEFEFIPTSTQLKELIKQNWNANNSLFGTKDGDFKNYSIYFDEGISVRKIDGTVFNIVFNEKYSQEVLKGVTTQSTKEQVITTLGKPHFENNELIGYKTNDFYIFFYKNEISIYRKEISDTNLEFAKIVEKYSNNNNIIQLTTELKNTWKDYNLYKYDTNYVVLQYALRGVSIMYNYNNNNGIFIYNNFKGNVDLTTTYQEILNNEKEIPNKIYLENKNLVFEAEKNRILNQNTINYDVSNIIKNYSQDYILDITTIQDSTYNIKFISKDKQNINRELKEYINSGIWLDNENFIYSVNEKGIYKFNVKNNTYTTIKTGKEIFKINKLENGILHYNDTSIDLKTI